MEDISKQRKNLLILTRSLKGPVTLLIKVHDGEPTVTTLKQPHYAPQLLTAVNGASLSEKEESLFSEFDLIEWGAIMVSVEEGEVEALDAEKQFKF